MDMTGADIDVTTDRQNVVALGTSDSVGVREAYPVGEFIVWRDRGTLAVAHRESPDRLLWEGARDGNFLVAEQATAAVRAFGTPEGSFTITDAVSATYARPTIDHVELAPNRATVSGRLTGPSGGVAYELAFETAAADTLRFVARVRAPDGSPINRVRLRIASTRDEAFFGFGQQLTYFDQKGKVLPILVQEHGVGRGLPVVTQLVDLAANGGGRNPYVTEAPAPHFISSRLRSLCLENTEYSVFDLRHADHVDIKVWSAAMTGRIFYGRTPLDLIEAYTAYAGRMRALPDWVHNGVIAAVQGGTDIVRGKLETLRSAGVPLAGLWIQDWTGVRVTSAGAQLWWDWKLDESFYHDWRRLVSDLEGQGARMLLYVNPFLSTEPDHDALYREGGRDGYLVEKADGTPYLIKNTNFAAALIDLSNPETRTWIKAVIRREMIDKAGASGWMADFGEALPFDAKLHDGDPAVYHNRFTEEWARVNREVIEEAGRGDDAVCFHRSGFTQSPGAATLFWLGDQLQSWDEYDGIKTAVVGLLSGGVSGFSLVHSDTGGYVVLKLALAGRAVPVFARTPELLMRWMELNAFTAAFRTHEGLDPALSAQFDTNTETLAHLVRFAKVYQGLAPYRKRLVADAAARGHPVVRHPFLHYPDDPNTLALRYQFLLGPDLLVAPVLDKGADAVDVYFPAGSAWTDLWTGIDAGQAGSWVRMPAPLSRPAVFVRKGASSATEILDGLRHVGVL
ncbi:alpha-glucosidase [Gemmatimonadetes bacterium T265]|nr:alpha-glucosidase [Gemmatimonadetes bacterium T265]